MQSARRRRTSGSFFTSILSIGFRPAVSGRYSGSKSSRQGIIRHRLINWGGWVDCPNSQIGGGCQDEAELIANYIAKEIRPDVIRWFGGNTGYATNPRIEGSHSPYNYARGSGTSGLLTSVDDTPYRFIREEKFLVWETHTWEASNPDHVQSSTNRIGIFRSQAYQCPQGMEAILVVEGQAFPILCQQNFVYPDMTITNPRQKDSCPVNGNPCHPSSTDKSRAETDFTFAGRAFTRYYHSLREVTPPSFRVGNGWTHTFTTYLMPPWTSAAGIHTGTGYRVDMPGYRFVAPSMDNALMEMLADGTWRLTEANGDISTFSSSGRLTSVRNKLSPERDVVLNYGANYLLESVTDAAGGQLRFSYDRNLLTGVTLPDGRSIAYGHDDRENLVSVDYGNGQVKQYHYGEEGLATNGDPGLLTGITNESGDRYASFGYDIYGRVLFSTLHGEGGQAVDTTRIYYNAANSAQVTTADGVVRTYIYGNDGSRKPLSISDAGGTTSYTYDSYGRMLTHTDARDVQTRYTYTNSVLTAVVSAYGTSEQRTEQTDWHATLNAPTERRTLNASGVLVSKATWTYNARGQVLTTTQIDPASGVMRTTTNTYCEQTGVDGGACPRVGLLLTVDGPRTDVSDLVSYAYYASDDASCAASPITCPHRKGDLWKTTNALGQVAEVLSYDGAGRPAQVKDANGVITEMAYHARGWLTSRTVKGALPAEDRSTLIDYWPTGLVKRVTQADGSYTQYTYDAAHRLTDIADSAGNTLHYTLNNAGHRAAEATRDPNGMLTRTLSRVYNQLGQLQSQSDAYSHATGYTYDANGNTDAVTDALGRGTDNAYDPLNRLVQTLQDVGGIAASTQFQYDAQDNLTRVTDPKGLHTDYAYNGLGDLTRLTSPDTGIITYSYDSAGNRASQTDARAKVQAYTYDALNRLTRITGPTRTYVYDNANTAACPSNERFARGRLSGFTDPSGSTKYCYNRFGEVVRRVQTTNGLVFTTRYGHDAAGRLTTQTYPDGAVLDAVRDGEGRIVELGITPNGRTRQTVLTGATYAPFGPSTGWTYGNGRSYLRSLNRNYQPEAIHDGQAGGLSLGYGFDAVGNLTTLKNADHTDTLAQYGYDALNRLTQTKDGPTGTPIETYGYDATGNRQSVTNAGATTAYTYPAGSHRLDKVGNVARIYDAAGNTTKIGGNARQFVYDNSGRMTQTKAGSTVTRNYHYNAKGEQVRAYLDTANAYFVYDEAGHLLGEYDNAGAPKQQILWFGDLPVGVLHGSGASQALHYIEPDHLGTPRVVIDGVRNVPIWKWDLTGEAFGNTPPNQDPDADGTVFDFDLRYPGQRYDAASGLNYNYFRDYDPSTGRYVESDPLGISDGPSTYGYVQSNSLMGIDPFGLTSLWFNARTKTLTVVPTVGPMYRITGSSGRQDCDRCTSKDRDKGPIPSGNYRLYSRELTDPNAVGDLVRNFAPGGGDWGDWRVPLWPEPGTETFGRDKFFLHGGSLPGSAGCIDIGGGLFGGSQSNRLKQDIINDPDGVVNLHVR